MTDREALRMRRWSYALGASMAAIAAASATPAAAQCSPDPTLQFGTTDCTGIDEDGFAVTSIFTQVNVASDAVVRSAGAGGAITIDSYGSNITVRGLVDGGAGAAVAVTAGPATAAPCAPYSDASSGMCYPRTSAAVTVVAGGTLTGTQAVLMSRDASNPSGQVGAFVYNAGTITGTAGPAIVNAAGNNSTLNVSNFATGEIGGIAGKIDIVDNAGLIYGGAGAAIAGALSITNDGRILSTGSSAIVSGANALDITNRGRIEGHGIAISAAGALTFSNSGTIVGSVVSTAAAGEDSIVHMRAGTILGDLVLGAGDDIFYAPYDTSTGRVSSITGSVDGGAGSDTIMIRIGSDTTFGPVALPTNFEIFGLELVDNALVTLSPAFTGGTSVALNGSGRLVNQADFVTTGTAVKAQQNGWLSFRNEANIAATLADPNQASVEGFGNLINNGTITASGGIGVRGQSLVNNGTITATATAAQLTDGTLANSGSISSIAGVGASLSGSIYFPSTNSGTIDGATTGLVLQAASITNSGMITGMETGVELTDGGLIVNAAGGTITGGTNGITNTGPIAKVVNAGAINGTVRFALPPDRIDSSNDVFVDAGGIVNGAILFGGGDDQLVVNLVTDPARPFAGATGGVDAGAGYDTLRYLVNADADVDLALTDSFEGLAYELANDADLILTAVDPITTSIGLIGKGTVTLNGTISASDRAVVNAMIPTVENLIYGRVSAAQDLRVINNGTISLTNTGLNSGEQFAVRGWGRFTNNGVIAVINEPASNNPAYGVYGASTVTNAGTITLTGGGTGIDSVGTLTNTGTITDTDDANARGVRLYTSLDNRGTISVHGEAVAASNPNVRIINSGTIESRSATAVYLEGNNSIVINEATGKIVAASSDASAISFLYGTTVINRGSIAGDVAARQFSTNGSTYIADGGTLDGDISFGAGGDTFVMMGSETGVTGTINGGAGADWFGYALTDSASVSLDVGAQFIGFEHSMVQVADADAVATVTAATPFTGNLYASGTGKVINTATINGNIIAQTRSLNGAVPPTDLNTLAALENQGTISGNISGTINHFENNGTVAGTVTLNQRDALAFANSGAINAGNGRPAVSIDLTQFVGEDSLSPVTLVNSGTISSNISAVGDYSHGALSLYANLPVSVVLTNTAEGVISADNTNGFALSNFGARLTIDNAGTIRGATGAIQAYGLDSTVVRNSGTLDGTVLLALGRDRIENTGTITGAVLLDAGDDVFVQHAGATLGGVVDGGYGSDLFTMVADADGALDASQIIRFQHLNQTGTETVSYSGTFAVETIDVEGGTLEVAAGQTLATSGPVTVTGGNAGVHVRNMGTIAGMVQLGAGNDSYTEGAGSTAGRVYGGTGTDLYRVVLAGDRIGIGARTGFEQLAVDGSGALTLALDQDYQSIALSGTDLTAALGGHVVGRIDGSGAAERVVVDGDVAVVSLGAGDDSLSLAAPILAGNYAGGLGTDAFHAAAAGPVTLTGSLTGFETLSLAGGVLNVTGTLGAAGDTLLLDGGAQDVTLATGGIMAAALDLGAGDDSFRLASGGMLTGSVDGGAGTDTAILELVEAFTLQAALTGFERLQGEGNGALTVAGGNYSLAEMNLAGDLIVAAGASLSAGAVTFGPANNTLTIAGSFAGSVFGGAGVDAIAVSGRADFASITGMEALRMSAGIAAISGTASLGSVALAGGRLTGLAGSTINAATITVAQGATFGSAGTVNGNLAVSGTLSPGASPGTMTVNGNVALAGTSVSVFEVTPSVSDKLVVNGQLAIAQGATLQIEAGTAVTPGRSLELITASGNITGSFTNVFKPASLFGFLVQDADSITLMGQFLNDANYSAPVSGAIDYVNGVLVSGTATGALLAAVPRLVTSSGASDAAAFALLPPEVSAAAGQIVVEQGLELATAGRSDAFASRRETPGAFTFASVLGSSRTLDDGDNGTARTRMTGHGFLGGVGLGGTDWSIGAFVGYLDSRQTLFGRGARTDLDGVVAGVHARWTDERIGVKATLAYSGGDARTSRAVPDGTARSQYGLTGWTGDISVNYAVPLSDNWTVQPSVGVTAIRVTRDGAVEEGGSAYALSVLRERDHAVFVDGGLTFQGGKSEGARLRPHVSLGVRYQADGRAPYALAALGGGGYGLEAVDASRAPVLATASLGADFMVSSRLTLFGAVNGEAGDADSRAGANAGLRLTF